MDPTRPHLRTPSSQSGFTLIEIMVVIAILGLLAALIAPNVQNRADDARLQTARVNARLLADAAKLFYVDHGRLPELAELTGGEGGKAYVEEITRDPWGAAFVLKPSERKGAFEITSPGPNGVDGDEDDITSKPSTASTER